MDTRSESAAGFTAQHPAGMQAHRGGRLHRLAEPHMLFPLSALVTLLIIWGATLLYLRLLRAEVESHSLQSTQQILETYEAQVIRSLGEIDRSLGLVVRWRAQGGDRRISALAAQELLPPDLVFAIRVVDSQGRVVDSNQAVDAGEPLQRTHLDRLRDGDVNQVIVSGATVDGATPLQFARRLETAEGAFDGAVVVEVDAAFFVSGYESKMMGERGLLAVVGPDGRSLVERVGEQIRTGGTGLAALVGEDAPARRVAGVGAGQARWMASRTLFDFPLSVAVGLSVEEQYEVLRHSARGYYALAALASLVCLSGLAVLGRLGWQLARSRERELRSRQEHAERVEYMAYHDGLTGLANRSLFSRLLSREIAAALRHGRQAAVFYLDLDRFKPINDTLGHEAGDELLKTIAQRLLSCMRTSDAVARLGGDEFVVLMPDAGDENEVAGVAGKILDAVGQPLMLAGREVCVTASIGIALCPRDGRDEDTLKRNADAAMYHAKALGKNNFRFYTDQLDTTSLERLSLEANLRHALERDELRLYYRARRDLGTGRICGMEAMLHWEHPDIGVIPPSRFMAVAEESGAIVSIGRWVLRTACEHSLTLGRTGAGGICVTVTLTASQFYDDRLLEDVRTTLARTGLAPWLLELAIPESALTHRPEPTRARLQGLREIGVRMAIGDFGTGYAWLDDLRDFTFDTIRIDPSFTRRGAGSGRGNGLASAVVALGRRLSSVVVAQEIAGADEARSLREYGVEGLREYCEGDPRPLEQFATMLMEQDVAGIAPGAGPQNRSRTG